jgi:hypothetical protein
MSTLVGIKLAARSADDTRRIPVTPIQQPLTTDVIVTLQGSAAVISTILKMNRYKTKCKVTPQGCNESIVYLREETK